MVKPQITIKNKELLEYFAPYIWWEDKDEMIANNPLRIIAIAMKNANDVKSFLKACEFGQGLLKETLKQAQAGWFDNKNWYFWHYKLYGYDTAVPALPKRGYLQ